jgi:heme exporter protein A
VRALSRGLVQRVAIARALVHNPRVLLLDEPFTGLDRIAAEALSRLLGQHAAAGRATVLVTHNVEEGTELATDVAFTRSGRFVQCAPRAGRGPAQVAEDYRHAIA